MPRSTVSLTSPMATNTLFPKTGFSTVSLGLTGGDNAQQSLSNVLLQSVRT